MNRIYTLSILFFFLIISHANAQVFWSEDFGAEDCSASDLLASFTSTNGSWNQTETGVNGNQNHSWYVSAREAGMGVNSCGEKCINDPSLTNKSLHINNIVLGDQGANYIETGFGFTDSDIRAETPPIDCSNRTNIILDFLYFSGGVPGSDFCVLQYFDGILWQDLLDLAPTETDCAPEGKWMAAFVNLPVSADNNPNVKLGFRWINVDDEEFSPGLSVAIDDITLSGIPDGVAAGFIADSTNICAGDCIDFSDQSIGLDINDWVWVFEGAETPVSSDQHPENICYTSAGEFDVTLFVSDGVETDEVTLTNFITVETIEDCSSGIAPVISIGVSAEIVENGGCVNFSDQTEVEGISDWLWTFDGGDPSFSVDQNPTQVCYPNPGLFDVSLQLNYNGEVFDSTFSNLISVVDTSGPVANFDYTPVVCLGQCYSFENMSTGGDTYFWTFEGAVPSTSQEENPEEICYLNSTGTFNVTLTAMDQFGSSTSITQQITVVNPPNLNAGQDQYISGGTSTTLSATGGNGTGNFIWQPAELVSCFECASTGTVPLSQTTTFIVSYEQSGGCLAFDELTVFVDSVSSVDESAMDFKLLIYPNPGTGEFTLVLPQEMNSAAVEIFGLHGKRIHSRKYTQRTIPIGLTGVPAGIYFVKVSTENHSSIARIVKQ